MTGAEFTEVRTAAMQQGINDLLTARNKMGQELEQMEGQLTSLLGQSWQGVSHDAYLEAKRKYNAAMNEMLRVVQVMQSTLGNITDNYATNERQIHSMWA